MIFISIIISFGQNVNRSICCFRLMSVFFGILIIMLFALISLYLFETGFHPDLFIIDDNGLTVNTGRVYTSYITYAGVIVMISFVMPFLLRLGDCLRNPFKYFFGVFAYVIMMPTYANIMLIYSMCNLHDVSWGNRPSSGEEHMAGSRN